MDHPQNFFVDVRDFFSFNSVFVFVFVSEKKTYLKTWISGVSKLDLRLVMVLLLSQLDHFTLRRFYDCNEFIEGAVLKSNAPLSVLNVGLKFFRVLV